MMATTIAAVDFRDGGKASPESLFEETEREEVDRVHPDRV